jgi:PAS domain S-box-containing protein
MSDKPYAMSTQDRGQPLEQAAAGLRRLATYADAAWRAAGQERSRLRLLATLGFCSVRYDSSDVALDCALDSIAEAVPEPALALATGRLCGIEIRLDRRRDGVGGAFPDELDLSEAPEYARALTTQPATGRTWVRRPGAESQDSPRPLYLRKPIITSDVRLDRRLKPILSFLIAHDIGALLWIPVSDVNGDLTLLAAARREPGAWPDAEIDLLTQAAGALGEIAWEPASQPEDRLRRLTRSETLGAAEIDASGLIQRTNDAALELLGVPVGASRVHWSSLAASGLDAGSHDARARALAGEEISYRTDFQGSGVHRPAWVSLTADDAGRMFAVLLGADRLVALEAASQRCLKDVQALPDAALVAARSGAILHANPAARRLLEPTMPEARSLSELFTDPYEWIGLQRALAASAEAMAEAVILNAPTGDLPSDVVITEIPLQGKVVLLVLVRPIVRAAPWARVENLPDEAPQRNEPARSESLPAETAEEPAEPDAQAGSEIPQDALAPVLTLDEKPSAAEIDLVLPSARPRSSEALVQAEQQYQRLLDNLPDLALRHNRNLEFSYVSPAIFVYVGRHSDDYIGKGLAELARSGGTLESWQAAIARVFETGEPSDLEFTLSAAYGVHTFLARLVPEVSGDEIRSVLTIARDITGIRRAEEQHRALERGLMESQKMESLGAMAAGIAHEFNNLLQIVSGNAELAQMEMPPGSAAISAVEKIETAARRATELTQQMLAYSGKGRFVLQQVNLNTVVNELAAALKSMTGRRVTLRYQLARNLPMVEGDPERLRQVVTSLVTNASEAIGDRRGAITITTGALWLDHNYLEQTTPNADAPEGSYVFLEVADNGSGMDAETLSRMFEPFFTTRFVGRGLGLAAVHGIARSHRGTIHVESEVGKGSRVRFLLPAIVATAPEDADEALSDDAWRGSGTALVIDDDDMARAVTARMLERLNFSVLQAADGFQGLAILTAQTPAVSCVILDMTMPLLSGEQTLTALRRQNPDVPVLLTSGYSQRDAAAHSAREHTAFIQKPISIQALSEKLRGLLQPDDGGVLSSKPSPETSESATAD